jgi:hypothetical protein
VARILVAGMVAADPGQGGATSALLQYVYGLRALAHDVTLVDPVESPTAEARRYFESLALADAHLTNAPRREYDVLLNVSGRLRDPELLGRIPVRVYLDLDPAFNQLWDAQGVDVGFDGHTHFVTVGGALGTSACSVPTGGRNWIGTLPPVVLDLWAPGRPIVHAACTTVGNWRSYGSIEHDGVFYGQKAHALRPLFDLPYVTGERFVLALAIHPDERSDFEALVEHGWELVDPLRVAGTPATYADFVRGSRAEFGLAKHGYVVSRCGWFSDRSACYLAAGRPVMALDTGFGGLLPTGEGLFAVSSAADVVTAAVAIGEDYERHAAAAHELARELLDARLVLARLLERVGIG